MNKPAFLITIDTEGDNLWRNRSGHVTTRNADFLARFQQVCEKYAFKPTWLTNYEMAVDPVYIEFARDVIARNTGEVGMHLHAWNSPPEYQLTENDWHFQPYLIEYPRDEIRKKVAWMTQLLEETFHTKMLSHRAGRWAFDEYYAQLLIEFGYQVDCSVTPGVNWQYSPGAPQGKGGSNYTRFPRTAYYIDIDDISRPGGSPLLEVPMSIQFKHCRLMNVLRQGYDALRGKKRSPSVHWLRPVGGNVQQMINVAEKSLASGADYVEFMLHSSEFMPDGSPTFKNEADIDRLYDDLDTLFSWLHTRTQGMTLAEYAAFKSRQGMA
ncbi:deacetylase [Erwinia endophytica]|uniref:deacetylase n=1 Tax=Erwinia endophytica TaxID=1563158 RepID=UPI001266056E|nr:deacetylase [Erwinia endophytica]KAB8310524.1 deacetylase [Erwinia endophytica]